MLLERVLEPGPMAVVAVAEVALGGDDRLDDVGQVVGRHPRDRAAEHRVRVVGPGVAHAHPAAGEHDEAGQLAGESLAQGRDDADVVRMDVDAVVARPGDADLELARQVGVAVERLHRAVRGRGLAVTARSPSTHSSQYDGVRGRNRRTSSATTGCQHGPPVGVRQGTRHHVAHHVAARGERREQ